MVDGKVNRIIYEDNHLLVVEKLRNELVQKDNTSDLDLLTKLKNYIKNKYNKPGNVYLGLVHRLDRPVGGLMVFAKTSKAAERLSKNISNHEFQKTYLAIVSGNLKNKKGIFEDYLLKLENENKTIVNKNGKYAKLEYEVLDYKEGLSLVKINLITGRTHQIRVQFASRGIPLWGDNKYNKDAVAGEQIALWAYKVKFLHPTLKDKMEFKLLPPLCEYPWNLFGDDLFE